MKITQQTFSGESDLLKVLEIVCQKQTNTISKIFSEDVKFKCVSRYLGDTSDLKYIFGRPINVSPKSTMSPMTIHHYDINHKFIFKVN